MKIVPLKGKIPKKSYSVYLTTVFNAYKHRGLSSPSRVDKTDTKSTLHLKEVYIQIMERVFPDQGHDSDLRRLRLPCRMGDFEDKLQFNLRYQDTRLKLEVEEYLDDSGPDKKYNRDVKTLMETLCVILNSTRNKKSKLWQEMNDNDLDAVVYEILNIYNPARLDNLLKKGIEANSLAIGALPAMDRLEKWDMYKLIRHQIFSGTVWWNLAGTTRKSQFINMGNLVIDDSCLFLREIRKKRNVLFILDDNGELVWDLLFIQQLLRKTPQLRITVVANTEIVDNNANVQTISWSLQHSSLKFLRSSKRFKLLVEPNKRSSLDLNYCSNQFYTELHSTDLIYIKGVGAFETMQNLPTTTYYAFVVYSKSSQKCTGLNKGQGVFVRIPKNTYAYRVLPRRNKLLNLYSSGKFKTHDLER